MEQLAKLLETLQSVKPALEEFMRWRMDEAKREEEEQQRQSESTREFNDWLKKHRQQQEEEARAADQLAESFFGGTTWESERFSPRRF